MIFHCYVSSPEGIIYGRYIVRDVVGIDKLIALGAPPCRYSMIGGLLPVFDLQLALTKAEFFRSSR